MPSTMISGLPPLPWLRAFEAAARTGGFTAAARELNLTQAAISYQVRALEDHLGCALFDRLPRGVRLTPLGIAYLEPVRKAFDELAISTLGLFGSNDRLGISVLAPVSFGALWLAPRLPDFMARHPAIDVRLSATIWGNAAPSTAVDLEIRYGDGKWLGYRSELLVEQDLVIACSPELGRRAAGTGLAALVKDRMIHIMGHENHWPKLAAGLGLAVGAAAGPTVDTIIGALELAANHAGCVVTHRLFLASYLATGRLVTPLARGCRDEQAFYIAVPERPQRVRRDIHLFREWLKCIAAAEAGPVAA